MGHAATSEARTQIHLVTMPSLVRPLPSTPLILGNDAVVTSTCTSPPNAYLSSVYGEWTVICSMSSRVYCVWNEAADATHTQGAAVRPLHRP